MSVHGNQKVLPMFFLKGERIKPASLNEEMSLAFYLLAHDLKEREKIKIFSRLVMPISFIQGIISTHIALEGISFTGFFDKITNPPRQALIGHILRNVDNRSEMETLDKIIEVLSYKDKDAKEFSTSEEDVEEAEFQKIDLPSILNPNLLNGLKRILPNLETVPISDYALLDTLLTTDQALDLAEKYRNTVELLKGNSLRWQGIIKLIQDEIDKWLIELNVKLKDLETRYNSEIGKIDKVIDTSMVDERLKEEKDQIELWIQNQKKSMIESLLQPFITVERKLHEMIKRNKFLKSVDSLKTNRVEDVISKVQNHLKFLEENTQDFLAYINNASEQIEPQVNKVKEIDERAETRLKEVEENLKSELEQKDQKISQFKSEKDTEIGQLGDFKKTIETKFREITAIVSKKSDDCLKEIENLKKWNMEDKESEHLSMPVIWIYLPIYMLVVEDEEEFEERIELVLPCFINQNASDADSIKEELDPEFTLFLEKLNSAIENDMKIRSNFEFTAESKNLLAKEKLKSKLQKGVSLLKTYGNITEDLAKQMENKINIIP